MQTYYKQIGQQVCRLDRIVAGPNRCSVKKKIKIKGHGGHGHMKSQKVLREACDGEPEVNLFRVFGIVVHAGYCHHLNPPVPAGSTAADAVMWMLHKPNVKRQLLKSVRTCLI